jgi:putative ubiquitin-RnfH superfamily antitoxin RatB of RatAB toxin-antitoxin module
MNTDTKACIRATVVYARPDRQWVVGVELDAGATIGDAVVRSGLLQLCPELAGSAHEVGIFHRRRTAQTVLHDGDRIEIYRTLQIDAKQARRLRAGGKRAGRIPKAGGEA